MDLMVVAAIITGTLTVIGTLLAQHSGRLATGLDTETTLTKQGEQLDQTLKAQSEQKRTRRWPNSTSGWTERSQSSALEP
jgi:outer membrane murein-binding lipoprotein Lpp